MGFLEAPEQGGELTRTLVQVFSGNFSLRLLQQNRSHLSRVARAGAAGQAMNKGLQQSLLSGTKIP